MTVMPVIKGPVKGPNLTEEERKGLIEKLESELAGRPSAPEKFVWEVPLIFEIPLERLDGTSDRMDVLVVWDALEGIRSEERSALILSAYHEKAEKIVQAFGVTRVEAMDQHLIPYNVRNTRAVDPAELNRALISEGGFMIGNHAVLYLPTRKMAEAALAHLYEKVPSGGWGIAESVNYN